MSNSEVVDTSIAEAGEESDVSNEEFCAAVDCTEPLGDNIKWVQCDGSCDRWFHMVCVGLTKIRKKETYLCEGCTDSPMNQTEVLDTAEDKAEALVGTTTEAEAPADVSLVKAELEAVETNATSTEMEVDQC